MTIDALLDQPGVFSTPCALVLPSDRASTVPLASSLA
jgi:hypothetical protein